jgi:hypothetical protein
LEPGTSRISTGFFGLEKHENGVREHCGAGRAALSVAAEATRKGRPVTTDEAIEALRDEMRAGFADIRVRVDGMPFLGASIESLRHDVRLLRAAINDMARVNITAGEVEALHADLDRLQSGHSELATRLATVERVLGELTK